MADMDKSQRRIMVRIARDGNFAKVEIADTGPGISSGKLKEVFEPFYTTKPSGKGLGLGLAISKFIVDAIGGKIECHNLSTGGLEFIIVLRHADKPT